jgi:hypothetical protein
MTKPAAEVHRVIAHRLKAKVPGRSPEDDCCGFPEAPVVLSKTPRCGSVAVRFVQEDYQARERFSRQAQACASFLNLGFVPLFQQEILGATQRVSAQSRHFCPGFPVGDVRMAEI